MTIENGYALWKTLLKSGVQETRTLRGKRLPGYDAELVSSLRKALYPAGTRSLETELRSDPPSSEDFLAAFFGALKPFSDMLSDVLGMFETAGAKRSDANLRIAFDFDKASPSLALTLEQFRDIEAFFRNVSAPSVVRVWDSSALFALSRDVEGVLEPIRALASGSGVTASEVQDPRVRQWAEQTGRPVWIPFPSFPRVSGVAGDVVRSAEELINLMIVEVRKVGETYDAFARGLQHLPRDGGPDSLMDTSTPRRSFVQAAHDFWPNSFARYVCLAIEAVDRCEGKDREAAGKLLEGAVEKGFARPPQYEQPGTTREKDFRTLVNLPIWKKRHELYAVWVGSQIAAALNHLSWTWHPDGDTLRFSFGGVELATLQSPSGDIHTFWTEKRTRLAGAGLSGRKHIQPDYRIDAAPSHRHDATALVVECKQYRKWSKKNFGTALEDYAKGCPKAPVILVNYGPTDPSILTLVDRSRRRRTSLVGEFKPGDASALEQFRKLVRGPFDAAVPTPLMEPLDLELSWDSVFRDLDLHLFIRPNDGTSPYHIGFNGTRGSVTEAPWAEWPEDATRSPPGVERMSIGRWIDADYDVLVHNYSGSEDFSVGSVRVRAIRSSGTEHILTTPRSGSGRWLHVCRIYGTTGRIDKINLPMMNPGDAAAQTGSVTRPL